ncbi:oxidoreductase [Steroidobacter agaridevorans]|uniref:Oxidoreductase n=2 Tax=Steroidobacter agaridevorans TaxID=2695856 RepID=A0A829YGX6_9GAMM|nr:oxidoreductase [Steroidobacter agaridevorans]
MDLGISGRMALVCGGSRGIGYATARRLASEGARVTIVARTHESAMRAAGSLHREAGGVVEGLCADLSTPEGRAEIIAAYPHTDILIAHAGTPQRPAEFESLSRTDWEGWFDAHFYSALDLIRAYTPGMKQRRFGRIVNVSASFIKFPQIRNGHSHAARLALAGAIAALVRELAPFNVTINSVLPGLVDTDALRGALSERARQRGLSFEAVLAETIRTCPAGRIASADEMGDLIATLAGSPFAFMTGQNVVVDGGAYPGLF